MPNNSQVIHMVPNKEHTIEDKAINAKALPNICIDADQGAPCAAISKPSHMVQIVSHSFCDFLGTLPGAESRCKKTKNIEDSVGSHTIVSDNIVSETQNNNSNSFLLHQIQSNKKIGSAENKLLTESEEESILSSQRCQHNQNKVTVFVPYSTIVRCMNETMDRKRRYNKRALKHNFLTFRIGSKDLLVQFTCGVKILDTTQGNRFP
jgi:hypothetical protein